MPELPEVETVVRDLGPALRGRSISEVMLLRASVVRFPDAPRFVSQLCGACVAGVSRRGKYIVVALREDVGDLVVHLGMTGHLEIRPYAAPLRAHTHLRLVLDDGNELRFADARRFGRVLLGGRATLEALGAMPTLGVEPLSEGFTEAALDAALGASTRPLKAALLDQRRIAGLGNIYIDEACFCAGVRPSRRCHRVTRAQRGRLHEAIIEVLSAAVGDRGTTVDDYTDIHGEPGSHQHRLLVYGREGAACGGCGDPLRRTVVASRGTHFCPRCQR